MFEARTDRSPARILPSWDIDKSKIFQRMELNVVLSNIVFMLAFEFVGNSVPEAHCALVQLNHPLFLEMESRIISNMFLSSEGVLEKSETLESKDLYFKESVDFNALFLSAVGDTGAANTDGFGAGDVGVIGVAVKECLMSEESVVLSGDSTEKDVVFIGGIFLPLL